MELTMDGLIFGRGDDKGKSQHYIDKPRLQLVPIVVDREMPTQSIAVQ